MVLLLAVSTLNTTQMHSARYLVIGSGLSGLYFALQVADRGTVFIVTKSKPESSNTRWAQGGICSVFDPADSFDAHIKDTLVVGAGLCREDTVRRVVELGPQIVNSLSHEYGAQFDRAQDDQSSPFALGREGGHTYRRVVHAQDRTGAEIERALLAAIERHPNIHVFDHHTAIDLLSWDYIDGTRGCFGAYVLDNEKGQVEAFVADVTILATGGAGKVYRYTSNPDVATADGIAMAYRLGAQVGNLEFMQFHPTCLYHPDAKSFLISEALRGEGGILRRQDGSSLMKGQHPLESLAPRDIVARAIDAELKRSGEHCVWLDMTHLDPDFVVRRFPAIHARCISLGIDMRKDRIPVVPAAHYTCGGVVVDPEGRSTIPGLMAIGEVSMSGMHGACRLASNSLLEAAAMAHFAAQVCDDFARPAPQNVTPWNEGTAQDSDEAVMITANWEEIRALMWNFVGIVRSDKRLDRARRRLALIREEIHEYYWQFRVTRDLLELRNLSLVAQIIVSSARRRKESRGLHYTLDYPALSPGKPEETLFTRATGPRP